MKKNKSKNAGFWFSVDDTNLPRSIYIDCVEIAKIIARSKGMKITAKYEIQHSDLPIEENPQAKRAIDDIKNGKIQALITLTLSMLGQRAIDIMTMCRILEANNAELISITEPFDTSDASGRFLFHMMASMVEFERALIKESGIRD